MIICHLDSLERTAALLDAHPDYCVLRALPPLNQLALPPPEGRERTAVILDTETTSLDPATGTIIELALCPVRFDSRGRITAIGAVQDWLEDPGAPLPEEISRLTGLTDADLAGQRIDDDAALTALSAADVLIAHNASFDARWIEQRYPAIAGKPWACSLKEVDWRRHGYESQKLGSLLCDLCGFFNRRHRADADVAALIALLTTNLPAGHTVCAEMLLTAMQPTLRVCANGAPFEVKDRLKARGYRWDQQRRLWCIEIRPAAQEAERRWLASEARCLSPAIQQISWFERHRG